MRIIQRANINSLHFHDIVVEAKRFGDAIPHFLIDLQHSHGLFGMSRGRKGNLDLASVGILVRHDCKRS